ncbi:hypothetical protein N7528_005998 [Penicillium herquei]|nr:hypothetical protein N7528_005998 [Penicillium herquei]
MYTRRGPPKRKTRHSYRQTLTQTLDRPEAVHQDPLSGLASEALSPSDQDANLQVKDQMHQHLEVGNGSLHGFAAHDTQGIMVNVARIKAIYHPSREIDPLLLTLEDGPGQTEQTDLEPTEMTLFPG